MFGSGATWQFDINIVVRRYRAGVDKHSVQSTKDVSLLWFGLYSLIL